MLRIRTALLNPDKKTRTQKSRRLVARITALFLVFLLPAPSSQLHAAFNDLPQDSLYTPYIERFQEANIIVGDTAGGQPTGNLRPFDQIKRSEFTKITTLIRLLEAAQNTDSVSSYQNLDLDAFTLKINEQLVDYYQSKPGAVDFKDVDGKDPSCASNPEGCEPWYGQYVNYAAAQGLIKGFPDGNFKPSDPILRIHALKLVMADDGNRLAYNDDRFSRLFNDPRIENVTMEKCLEGAGDYILKNNGGGFDAQNLATYASLADRLDFFGAHCEFFIRAGADTPEKRAALLQKPLTRQEIARYFALTSTYDFLKIDHSQDDTTSTKEENGMNYYNEEAKRKFEEMLKEDLEGSPLSAQPEEQEKTEEQKKAEENQKELIKGNKEKAEMTIKELTKMAQEGRCCYSMKLDKDCKKIKFKDYVISEESSYNYETYEGGAWHEAKKNGNRCWIPLEDIIGGFEENKNVKPSKAICGISSAQKNLMNKYKTHDYPGMVREIWTASYSNELKMFMQIGLDLAMKKTEELKMMVEDETPNCQLFQTFLEELQSGHIAASFRHLPPTDPKIKNAEKLIAD